jgi:hypothetical protein
MKSIKSNIVKLKSAIANANSQNIVFDKMKLNQGLVLSELNRNRQPSQLKDYEFSVFSQWGEDGILQHLIHTIDINNRTFIEFGVEDFTESNCRFLMMKDNWSGFVIDGSEINIIRLRKSDYFWKHDLKAISAFIDRDNVDSLLEKSGFDGDLGVLSIDIDGNDYYVLEAISHFRPRILICEYNAVFGSVRKIAVPYESDFVRSRKHHSNLYFGASLAAMTHLAKSKGYSLVGTTSAGNDAFFIRNDLVSDSIQVLSVEQAFTDSKFRESRDEQGNLSFVSGGGRLALIQGLPIYEVERRELEAL